MFAELPQDIAISLETKAKLALESLFDAIVTGNEMFPKHPSLASKVKSWFTVSFISLLTPR